MVATVQRSHSRQDVADRSMDFQRVPMKIVLDLQGAQSNSRHRGIGRYTVSMAKAFAEEAAHHQLWLLLNGRDDETSLGLIEQFEAFIPRQRMVINELPAGIAGFHPGSRPAQQIAAAAHAAALDSLQADCIWHSSLFEGWGDDSTAALGSGRLGVKQIATLYDLIPLLHSHRYLHNPSYRDWYFRRLGLLKRCDLLLAISESSRREAVEHLHIRADNIAVVSGAADPAFFRCPADAVTWARWKQKWRLQPRFLLYTGGFDSHKNVDALIAAFADLPASLRSSHQLVLAGRCSDEDRKRLSQGGRRSRLPTESLVFTGALDDADLASLYSSCELFISPSLHEGLGLPLLEAMACGAAVICSDAASLPEVVGRPDALFDPRSQSAIASKLQQTLSDSGFINSLRAHSELQTLQFTWSASARKALVAIEQSASRSTRTAVQASSRPRLIYVSPLPPARSGIADYSARLLRELASHYAIEVVVDQAEVLDPWIQANFPVRSALWFAQQADPCARVLYHFGNSPFHAHMFGLLEQHPGVVVLHDSWLGAARNWMANAAGEPAAFLRMLYESHGYAGLSHDLQYGRSSTLDAYPINRDVIEGSLGVIVHSRYSVKQADRFFGPEAADKFRIVPFPQGRTFSPQPAARRLLGLADDAFVVCSFGMLAPTKLNDRLLQAWLQSSLASDVRCHLVFVGENHGGGYGEALTAAIRSGGGGRIRVTGFASADTYADYLAAADLAVQLRTDSRGETSAAIFDVLGHRLPVIVNAHGSAAELPDTVALKISDRFSDAELVAALQSLRADASRRVELAAEAAHWIDCQHHPADVGLCYRDAIEHFMFDAPAASGQRLLADAMRTSDAFAFGSGEWHRMRRSLVENLPRVDLPSLYVDVTATASSVLHTGIERVVRGVLLSLLQIEQKHYRVQPVRMEGGRFLQANSYGPKLLDYPALQLPDDEVMPRSGDLLLGLDWVADILPTQTALLDAWRVRGVRIFFVVYDLLPVRMPARFPDGIAEMHARWLQCIGAYADALIGISRSVTDDLRRWFDAHPPNRRCDLRLGYFYPGSDPSSTRPSLGVPVDATELLNRLRAVPTFLMVGTVEPRKGHALVLDAFEELWREDSAVHLVVVGRQGWMAEEVAARMRSHSLAGNRLVWLEQASDDYLAKLYDVARALVAASEGEGFGLPLVEAAQRGLPVIARDIPVFREVSSSFAVYFDAEIPGTLVDALRSAAATARPVMQTQADAVLSWRETTDQLLSLLLQRSHPQWQDPWKLN
ncbi:glycosyltransferase [Rhodanobacter sp. BL-MT-08]